MTVIDAKDMIIGRVISVAARRALLGERIDIVNCEQAVMTGNKNQVVGKFKGRLELGGPQSGPFIPRQPEMLVKRMVRGMLPYKKKRGKLALDRVKCHVGVPAELEKEPLTRIESADMSRLKSLKYIRINELCRLMGAKL